MVAVARPTITATRTARTRDATILGRTATAARAHAPAAGRWLARTARRARTATLTLSGLGMATSAAWEVSPTLGKAAAAASLLLVEYLSAPSEPR